MIEKLKALLPHKKSKEWMAGRLGIDVEEINNLLLQLNIKPREASTHFVHTVGTPFPDSSITYSYSGFTDKENGTFKSEVVCDFEPKSDEELAELHKVDLNKYKISSYWTKQRGDKFTSSLHCTLLKPSDYSPEDFAKFLESYKPPVKFTKPVPSNKLEVVDIELSIADFHLAKKTLEGETLADKVEQFLSVVTELVERARGSFKIGTVVFPISNDFFHTDNYQNQTTAGTPQDVLTGFDHEYEIGFAMLATAIEYLQSVAEEVAVILVQGNHDRTKSFYLAHALEIYFKNAPSVFFDREHSVTKSVVLGATFIGYHHGNCKIDQLPLLFSTGKDSFDFGAAKFREVHTGDKHHYLAKEIMGCRMQQMPSLSGTDRWHQDNNFVHNVRAGLVLIYDRVKGKIGEFEARI